MEKKLTPACIRSLRLLQQGKHLHYWGNNDIFFTEKAFERNSDKPVFQARLGGIRLKTLRELFNNDFVIMEPNKFGYTFDIKSGINSEHFPDNITPEEDELHQQEIILTKIGREYVR